MPVQPNSQLQGPIAALWIPAAVAAHVLAAIFLWRVLCILSPKTAKRWRWCARDDHAASQDLGHSVSPSSIMRSNTVPPVLLSWSNLGCSYIIQGKATPVLQDVSGSLAAGQLAALLGPSGAGKSTFLDILAGRKTVGQLTGRVEINGRLRTKADKHQTAYVPQEVNFLPTMTVQETCSYHAALTMPPTTTPAQRQQRIELVLGEIGLSHAGSTLVGGMLPGGIMLRGLSGGERRRLAIATGLLAGPSLMFLDEPTSGLDSFAAYSVMKLLQQLAHQGGHTVLASLHQPRAAIWRMFDKVVLLSKGHLLYTGPCTGLVPWFDQLGYEYEPDIHGLPSDWVMDLINIDYSQKEQMDESVGQTMTTLSELQRAADLFKQHQQQQLQSTVAGPADAPFPAGMLTILPSSDRKGIAASQLSAGGLKDVFKQVFKQAGDQGGATPPAAAAVDTLSSSGSADLHSLVESGPPSPAPRDAAVIECNPEALSVTPDGPGTPLSSADGSPVLQCKCSWWNQLRVLCWKEFLAVTRNPADVAGRMLVFTYVSLIVGVVGYGMGSDLEGIRVRVNILFVQLLVYLLLPFVYMSLYTSDKQYFIADINAGLYRPSAYYLAKQLTVLPFALVNVLISGCIIYGLVGLRLNVGPLFTNLAFSVLTYLIAAQVLTVAAVVTTNQDMAFVVSVAWVSVNVLLANGMIRIVDMQLKWARPLHWFAATTYAFDGMVVAEFGGMAYRCPSSALSTEVLALLRQLLPNTSALQGSTVSAVLQTSAANCVVDLNAVRDYFTTQGSVGLDFGILSAYLVILHILAFMALKFAACREKR